MSSNLKSQLQQLIKAKEYRAAIVLLEGSTLPDKQQFIARIKARIDAEAQAELKPAPESAPEPVKAKPLPGTEGAPVKAKAAPVSHSTRVLLWMTAVIVIGLVSFGIYIVRQMRIGDIYAAMYVVCHEVYREDYYNDRFTAHQMVEGCLIVAQETVDRYGQEVNYCYDNQKQTDALFMRCLVDNDVTMYSTAIMNAPKE